jgi:membrane protease YdiL (CAAX protease family)
MLVIQSLVAIGIVLTMTAMHLKVDVQKVGSNGLVVSLASLACVVPVAGLIVFLVRVRRMAVRDYLALKWPCLGPVIGSVAGLLGLVALGDLITYSLGRPVVPEFMVDAYHTAGFVPLLVAAVVLGAPLLEEILFRGFLYEGIAASRAGPLAAVVFSSLLWAVIHVQYDLYQVGVIVVGGLYLGFVRYCTGSTLLTMLLHGLSNAIATAEVVVKVHWLS